MGRQVSGRRGWLLAAASVVVIGGIAAVHAPREVAPEPAQAGGRKKATDVVKIRAVAGKADGGKVPVTVTITIADGWHIYANAQPAGSSSMPTTVKVLQSDKEVVSKLDYPPGREVRDELGNCRVYEGRVEIQAVPTSSVLGPIQVSAHFQACHGDTCLLPATVKVPVE
jgi:DsbC/DsbD-like thiol-disulfide interchange protein